MRLAPLVNSNSQVSGFIHERRAVFCIILRSVLIGLTIGGMCGASSWLFLISLDWATRMQTSNPWLLYLLPLAGLLVAWLYKQFDRSIEAGNNLILEEIEKPVGQIPWPMAPLVAGSTVISHLFGASTGREGTAVQMGGSLADWLARSLKIKNDDRRTMLMCGVSGGFGAVFGTPLAGAIFGLEVLSIGRIRFNALLPCFISSVIGDEVCQMLGASHQNYRQFEPIPTTFANLIWVLPLGVMAGLTSLVFIELTHTISKLSKKWAGDSIFRPFFGGLIIILFTQIVGSRDYLGLSLPLIVQSFTPGGVASIAFLLKLVFTCTSLGTGFKGGEVTPLFCIGATLGHSFAAFFGLSVPLFAAVGFASVFAGAANTPVSCMIMGMELFGSEIATPMAFGCIVAYITSGHRSIYHAQRIDTAKVNLQQTETNLSNNPVSK